MRRGNVILGDRINGKMYKCDRVTATEDRRTLYEINDIDTVDWRYPYTVY